MKKMQVRVLLASLIPFSASFSSLLVPAWVKVVRECRSFLGKESGMEKVNGTDGAQKLTGRERGGSPSYFTHVPYLLPGTYPLGRVGLGQRTHPEPSQVTMSISAKPSPMSISPEGFLIKSC